MPDQVASPARLDPKVLLKTLRAFRKGDFSARLPLDLSGIDGEIAEAFNDVVELNQGLARELDRVAKVVGKEGQIGAGLLERVHRLGQCHDRRPRPADHGGGARHRGCRQG